MTYRMHSHGHGTPQCIACDEELTFKQKEVINGPMLMEFPGVTVFPTILKQLV